MPRRRADGETRRRRVRATLLAGVLAARAAAAADGWAPLVDRLTADGVPREQVVTVFADPRMGSFARLDFALVPAESHASYRGFLSPASVADAHRCFRRHEEILRRAEREQGVPAGVVAAIVYVESRCGRNTGSERILPRLARLAMANEPANVLANLERHARYFTGPWSELEWRTGERARYLEATFYPEVRGVFTIADRTGEDPLVMRGSRAGAFGIPQFLPTSYLRHGADADGDGQVSLDDPDDAMLSCASYLAANGWRPVMTAAERRSVLWTYNRSTPYAEAVLRLAAALPGPAPRAAERAVP